MRPAWRNPRKAMGRHDLDGVTHVVNHPGVPVRMSVCVCVCLCLRSSSTTIKPIWLTPIQAQVLSILNSYDPASTRVYNCTLPCVREILPRSIEVLVIWWMQFMWHKPEPLIGDFMAIHGERLSLFHAWWVLSLVLALRNYERDTAVT